MMGFCFYQRGKLSGFQNDHYVCTRKVGRYETLNNGFVAFKFFFCYSWKSWKNITFLFSIHIRRECVLYTAFTIQNSFERLTKSLHRMKVYQLLQLKKCPFQILFEQFWFRWSFEIDFWKPESSAYGYFRMVLRN